jgi:hypothetical protein
MSAENLGRYNLIVEQGNEIDKDYKKKEEIEDLIVNTGFFYDHNVIVLTIASKLDLNYKRIKTLQKEMILKTQGNPNWY